MTHLKIFFAIKGHVYLRKMSNSCTNSLFNYLMDCLIEAIKKLQKHITKETYNYLITEKKML